MSQRGFTLIEIAVVLAIIGMVLVLVLPRLPSTEGENLKSSARGLAAALRYVQDRAATGQAGYFVRLEPGTDKVAILQTAADGSEKQPDDPLLQKPTIKEGILVADVVVPRLGTVTDDKVRIDVVSGGLREFVAIHLRSADGNFWTVMAFPNGKIKVYEGYQKEWL